jgi:hypothetical protein
VRNKDGEDEEEGMRKSVASSILICLPMGHVTAGEGDITTLIATENHSGNGWMTSSDH